MSHESIFAKLPYSKPFLFVNELSSVTAEGAKGSFTFDKDAYFYEGHFKDYPITPGVILVECMAQIGVVCLGIFLLENEYDLKNTNFALSSTDIDFYLPVFPGETVTVVSEKVYFRFNKLKCKVSMFNAKNNLVAKGSISGMILKEDIL